MFKAFVQGTGFSKISSVLVGVIHLPWIAENPDVKQKRLPCFDRKGWFQVLPRIVVHKVCVYRETESFPICWIIQNFGP